MHFLPFLLLALLVLMALLAASEAALAATNRVRLRHLLRLQDEDSVSKTASSDLENDEQSFLAQVTLAANLPLVLAAGLTLFLALNRYETPVAIGASALVAFVTVTLFQVVPRLVVSAPGALEKTWWVRPARVVVALVSPLVSLLLWLGRLLLGVLGAQPRLRTESEKDESLRELVEAAGEGGELEQSRELIESIFTFGDTRVHEVMLPRPDIVSLPVECSAGDAMDLFEQSGLSRVPLRESSMDEIAGILHLKDVLQRLHDGQTNFLPREIVREPLYIPESLKIDDALALMRAGRTHLALVMDEFGGVAGLLTVEDILEELVGEIADEHDRPEEPILQLSHNTVLVDARLHAADLQDRWGVSLPVGEYDTVGGVVIERLGREPRVGDRVELSEAILTVHSTRGKRPHKIHVVRREKTDESDETAP